jgi:arsenite/tail-anchored protein-transporting ATPase
MRILLFSGKGGVGKTSLAAATGVRLAEQGKRTLVMSVDPAHSLADAFGYGGDLFHGSTSDPYSVTDNLWIHEVNIQREIKKHWQQIAGYMSGVFRTTGLNGVEADELAILPGMEELSAMMYVNQWRREERFDIMILDCAPTAESLRFISLPTTLDWYMKHVFPFQRTMMKAVRPLANRVSPVELPPDSYFANMLDLFQKLEGIDVVMEDPNITSVRLVTNAETMVMRETQRAFVYFSLYGLTVDGIYVNRVLPPEAGTGYFDEWRQMQQKTIVEMESYFAPVPLRQVPMFTQEVVGIERLRKVAAMLYAEGENPAAVTSLERPYTFEKQGETYEVHLRLPFAAKGEVGLFKKGDELVVEIGTIRRHIGLPTTMASLVPAKARLQDHKLVVELKEAA